MIDMYATRIIADRRPIDIVEVTCTDEVRTLRVTSGRATTWDIELTRWYAPSVGLLSDGTLAVWASTGLYLLVAGEAPRRFDLDDEVHAVFLIEGCLLVVTELSVVLLDLSSGEPVDCFDAEDVLGGAYWSGDEVHVEREGTSPVRFRPQKGSLNRL